MRVKTFSISSIVSLTLLFSACGGNSAINTTVSNSAANAVNKPNTAVVVNSNQTTTAASNTANVSNATTAPNANKTSTAPTPSESSEAEKIQGQMHLGKTESYIFYVGKESGDFAAFCFANDSEAGRKILAACKNGDQCEFTGEVGEGKCKVPDLEADLSASGIITKVVSVKALGKK